MPGSTAPPAGIVSVSDREVRTHGGRSLWLQQALETAGSHEHQSFAGHANTDVCIVGGGFTGLWT
ncbi:MAG TPA: hypothetical protein VHU61_02060, partial [Solirubrobacteraceae bacterium]|nr:hypothetical protein [Solirubrobacteraceae bacterium]